MPDEVYVEVVSDSHCPRTQRSTVGGLVFWGKHLLDSYCQQQHTKKLRSAEAVFHEVVSGAARKLFIRNLLQALELRAVVRVGTDSSAAAGGTQRLGAGRVTHLEVKGLWIQEKVRSHELKISRAKSEDNRADLLTKVLDHQSTSTECARDKARGGKLSSVGSGVLAVTSQSYSRESD